MEEGAAGPVTEGAVNNNRHMVARLSAFVIWAAVAASAVFWLLRLAVEPQPAPAHALPVEFAATGSGDWSRLLGREAAVADVDEEDAQPVDSGASSRFRLVGVVAPRMPSRPEGVALIAVDDGPAKAYRVGAVVDGTTVLQSVHGFGASLGPRDGAASVRLELPALPPPATGTLPPSGQAGVVGPAAGVPVTRAPALPMVRPPMVPQPVAQPPVAQPPAQGAGEVVEQESAAQ